MTLQKNPRDDYLILN